MCSSACLLYDSAQVSQGEQLCVVRNGLLIKDDTAGLMVLPFYQKSRSEELFMHPSRRMSFNLDFMWENTSGRSTRLKRIWERSWFRLLYYTVLLCPIIHLLPWGAA